MKVIEFVKKEQVDFEKGMLFDMGQLLSIPFILLGIFFIGYALRKKIIYHPSSATGKDNTKKQS